MADGGHYCGRLSTGSAWRQARIRAWCEGCGPLSNEFALFSDNGPARYPDVVALLDERIGAHEAQTGHRALGSDSTVHHGGFHSRCGAFHGLDDACPLAPDELGALVDRARSGDVLGAAQALDRLSAIVALDRAAAELREAAVVEARRVGVSWEDIARVLGVSRQAAFARYRDVVTALETGGELPRTGEQGGFPAVRHTITAVLHYVPYREANAGTKAGLRRRAEAEAGFLLSKRSPSTARFICSVCGFESTLPELGVAYGTPEVEGVPVCPTRGCSAIGWQHFAMRGGSAHVASAGM